MPKNCCICEGRGRQLVLIPVFIFATPILTSCAHMPCRHERCPSDWTLCLPLARLPGNLAGNKIRSSHGLGCRDAAQRSTNGNRLCGIGLRQCELSREPSGLPLQRTRPDWTRLWGNFSRANRGARYWSRLRWARNEQRLATAQQWQNVTPGVLPLRHIQSLETAC